MSRSDAYLDAMLRHLGAAYYESLHGRAARSDVARALDTVEQHLNEKPAGHTPAGRTPAATQPPGSGTHRHRWARRVSDVMTSPVVTVDRLTSYQEIDQLLTDHKISGLPVLKMGREVIGMVSEADLLAAEDETARQARMARSAGRRWPRHQEPPHHLIAGTLMTSPAVVIRPDATIPAAARLMNTHHIKRLPVVDEKGALVGIVSRRDILSVFLRPDADIAHDAHQVLREVPTADLHAVTVKVRNGVVTLTGTADPGSGHQRDLVRFLLRLIWDIDGVVDVVNKLGVAAPARTA